jgi:hypothetical protein
MTASVVGYIEERLVEGKRRENPHVGRQLVLPVATFISAGRWAPSTVHHRSV